MQTTTNNDNASAAAEARAKSAARLIAAAPDLLELLKVYVHIEETAAPYSSSPLREKACAAIARVEGSKI